MYSIFNRVEIYLPLDFSRNTSIVSLYFKYNKNVMLKLAFIRIENVSLSPYRVCLFKKIVCYKLSYNVIICAGKI